VENGLAFALGKQPAHGRDLPHLYGITIEAGKDAAQAEHIATLDERLPSVKVAAVRLPRHATAKPVEVALDDGAPLLRAVLGQEAGEVPVQAPGSAFGAGEVRDDRPPEHFVLVRDDYTRAKPDPEPYLRALNRFGAPKEEALVVEDSSRGLRSAVAAGIDCAIVYNEFTKSHDFSQAHYRIRTLAELRDIILGSS